MGPKRLRTLQRDSWRETAHTHTSAGLNLSDGGVDCIGSPRNDTGGAALALVARSRADGFCPVVSGFSQVARLAEVFLRLCPSQLQDFLPFEFSHGPIATCCLRMQRGSVFARLRVPRHTVQPVLESCSGNGTFDHCREVHLTDLPLRHTRLPVQLP